MPRSNVDPHIKACIQYIKNKSTSDMDVLTLNDLNCEYHTLNTLMKKNFNFVFNDPSNKIKSDMETIFHCPVLTKKVTTFDKTFVVNEKEKEKYDLNQAMALIERYASQKDLARLIKTMELNLEQRLHDFKDDIKSYAYSSEQYSLTQQLNEIESKVERFPLLAPKQACLLMGDMSPSNPSRIIDKFKKDGRLLVFSFGDTKKAQIPAFQFDIERQTLWPAIPRLCALFSTLSDWGIYQWFTTFDEDLQCSPAKALALPDKLDDLLDVAGLFLNTSQLRELSFTAQKNTLSHK